MVQKINNLKAIEKICPDREYRDSCISEATSSADADSNGKTKRFELGKPRSGVKKTQ